MIKEQDNENSGKDHRLFSLIYPNAEVIGCTGTMTAPDGLQIRGQFDIIFLLNVGLAIEMRHLDEFSGVDLALGSFDEGTFDGLTTDGQRVRCDSVYGQQMHFSSSAPLIALFVPQAPVTIGDRVNADDIQEFSCSLYNYFGKDFDLTAHGIPAKYNFSPTERDMLKQWSIQWRMPVETGELVVSGSRELDDAILLADKIFTLLTFLDGRYVSFCRYRVTDSVGNSAQTFMLRNARKPGFYQEVLYTTPIQSVLAIAAPVFLSMPDVKRDQLTLAITYLASAKAEQHLEQQTIDLSVAWEIFIDMISSQPTPLTPELEELKKDLKQTVSSWRSKHPSLDPNGKLTREVTKGLYPDPFLSGIRKSISLAGLSESKVGADPDTFKNLRHFVVHEGKADRAMISLEDYHSILWHMAFAADLVVLSHLGYHGPVYDRRLTSSIKYDTQMTGLAP